MISLLGILKGAEQTVILFHLWRMLSANAVFEEQITAPLNYVRDGKARKSMRNVFAGWGGSIQNIFVAV